MRNHSVSGVWQVLTSTGGYRPQQLRGWVEFGGGAVLLAAQGERAMDDAAEERASRRASKPSTPGAGHGAARGRAGAATSRSGSRPSKPRPSGCGGPAPRLRARQAPCRPGPWPDLELGMSHPPERQLSGGPAGRGVHVGRSARATALRARGPHPQRPALSQHTADGLRTHLNPHFGRLSGRLIRRLAASP